MSKVGSKFCELVKKVQYWTSPYAGLSFSAPSLVLKSFRSRSIWFSKQNILLLIRTLISGFYVLRSWKYRAIWIFRSNTIPTFPYLVILYLQKGFLGKNTRLSERTIPTNTSLAIACSRNNILTYMRNKLSVNKFLRSLVITFYRFVSTNQQNADL